MVDPQQAAGPTRLTPEELDDLQNDPRMQDATIRSKVMAKLAPEDQKSMMDVFNPPPQPSMIKQATGSMLDLGVGGIKGAGQTGLDIRNLLEKIPGVGDILSKLPHSSADLEPHGTAQNLGFGAERIGEFMIPADTAKKLAIEGLVRLIPDAASPGAMKVLNKAGAIIGRVAGEAGSAAGVSALHGENPDVPAALAGAGPLLGEAGAAAAPLIPEIAPMMAGIGVAKGLGGLNALGLAGGLGVYGMTRRTAADALPGNTVQVAKRVARRAAPAAMRLLAGAEAEGQKKP